MKPLFPLVFLLSAAACTELSSYEEASMDEAMVDSLLSVTESWDIQMEIIEDGLRVVNITAPYASTYHEDNIAETRMQGPVAVVVLDSLGTQTTKVTSGRAIYTGRNSTFRFREDVVVTTHDGRTLRTQELDWMQQDRSITSSDFVIIITPTDSIAGYGLEGLDDLSIYSISEVTGEFELD
ncbi:MAG: LPS export ABC transporter periplasmic protein LptC [Balneolales bacterium]